MAAMAAQTAWYLPAVCAVCPGLWSCTFRAGLCPPRYGADIAPACGAGAPKRTPFTPESLIRFNQFELPERMSADEPLAGDAARQWGAGDCPLQGLPLLVLLLSLLLGMLGTVPRAKGERGFAAAEAHGG